MKYLRRFLEFGLLSVSALTLTFAVGTASGSNESSSSAASYPVDFAPYGVSPEEYVQHESDINMDFYFQKQHAINEFLHLTKPISVAGQAVVRSNNDTLYSLAVVDARGGFSITLPDTGERYQSAYVISRDHYPVAVFYDAGEHQVTADTDYVFIVVRTQFNPFDQADIAKVANTIQPLLKITANSNQPFKMAGFDMKQHLALRKVLEAEASKQPSMAGMMAKKGKVDPWLHLLGAASGWGLLPDADATYLFGATQPLAAQGCFTATYAVPPVGEFWSITMYDKDSFLYTDTDGILNGYNVSYNEDGTFTAYFGSKQDCGDVANRLAITEGWNFLMRLYKPRLDELKAYKLPPITPVSK